MLVGRSDEKVAAVNTVVEAILVRHMSMAVAAATDTRVPHVDIPVVLGVVKAAAIVADCDSVDFVVAAIALVLQATRSRRLKSLAQRSARLVAKLFELLNLHRWTVLEGVVVYFLAAVPQPEPDYTSPPK